MRIFLFIILLSSSVFSTTIANHNIYKQDDSIDLMLTFDKPYLGKISKKKVDDSIILMLDNLKIPDSVTERIDSSIIQKIQILPYKEQIFIKVDATKAYNIQASKTVDNYGLRIRVKPEILKTLQTPTFETKKEQDLSGSFLKITAVLGFLVLLLYFLKKWLLNSNKDTNNWLFYKDPNKKQNIKIVHQKALDTKNRVALIEFNGMNYLVILGTNNVILDKFKSDEKDSDEQFDTLLNQNGRKLDALLQLGDQKIEA